MPSTKPKLRLTAAFAVLAILVLAASCRGFFVNPTLTGVSVGPSGVTLNVNQTFSMIATGTYSDGTTKNLTSGVVWNSDTPTVVSVDQNSGKVTGVTPGSANISASSGGCSACTGSTAVKVVLTGVTSITVSPSSQPATINGSPAYFTATALPSGLDITSTATWHIYDSGGTLQDSNFTIAYSAGFGEGFLATSSATAQTYKVVVSYPNTTVTGTASLVVN